jgi:hypothetical protein
MDSPSLDAAPEGLDPPPSRPGRIARRLMVALGVWAAIAAIGLLLIAGSSGKPVMRAVIYMSTVLTLTWNVAGGLLQWKARDRVRERVLALPGDWRLKFVLFCTLLALVEEAITTTLTNLAPLFGVPFGQAYITASGDYLDVVCLHSVVAFVPMFIGWSWMLRRWDFHPNAVFVLFGLTGTLAEFSIGGLLALLNIGFWSYIYGLMIYLPAYSLPPRAGLRTPRPWHYLMAVLLPALCVAPVAGIIGALHPVKIHFAPLQGRLEVKPQLNADARRWGVRNPIVAELPGGG